MLPGHLDRAAALATEPHGRRRDAHPQALPRGPAARRLRADRARPRADADSRRARPLGLRVGVEPARARPRASTSARSSAWPPACSAGRRPAAPSSARSTARTAKPRRTRSRSETTVSASPSAPAETAPTPASAATPPRWIKAFSPEQRPQRPGRSRVSASSPTALLDGLASAPRAARAAEAAGTPTPRRAGPANRTAPHSAPEPARPTCRVLRRAVMCGI